MANLLDQVSVSFGNFSWASIGQIAFVIAIFLAILIVFIIIFLFVWWKSFNYGVKIYEPLGQVQFTPEEIRQIKQEVKEGKTSSLNDKEIRFDMIRIKRTHGKYVTVKGTPYFQTFMPLRKHEPIPMELMYSDGVHLLRLSREIFIPIPKPKTVIGVGESVSISVAENNRWILWNNMMADKINNKYHDVEKEKRIVLYVIIGIVAITLIGGFILWLIYSSVNKGWAAADKFNTVADSLLGGNKPV